MLINSNSSPEDALSDVHVLLKRAGADRKHNFRIFSISTSGPQKEPPESRMVVLRSFSENWDFEFYTDYRTSKVSQINSNPATQALFWDPSKRVQVRIFARSIVHHKDDIASERWKNVQGDARKAYTQLTPPGTRISDPAEAHRWPETMNDDHFAVVRSVPEKIRILQLSGMEHLALEFDRSPGTADWSGGWVAP